MANVDNVITRDSLIGFIDRHARSRPDDVAIRYGNRRWSWAQLMTRVRRAAGGLRAAGIAPGDNIAFLDRNHPACLETLFAAAMIGASVTVINWRVANDELAHILNDCGVRLLFVGADVCPKVDLIFTQAPKLQRVITLDDKDDQYEAFLAAAVPLPRPTPVDDEDIAVVMYSSGTTGRPKGVLLSHRALVNHTMNLSPQLPFASGDANLVAMPLFHVGGICYALFGIRAGVTTIVTREADIGALVGAVETGATHAFLVPTVIASILDAGENAVRTIAKLRYIAYGAAPTTLGLLQRALESLPAVNFLQVYGQTEVSGVAATLSPADHRDPSREQLLLSVGKPVPGNEVSIVDPATGDRMPHGYSGEIWLRSNQCMTGYLNNPEATMETLTSTGWLRTGDIGHFDAEGYLYIDDRLKDMIITGGENVYASEVERVLVRCPGVSEAAVIGIPDDRWGESIMAFVTSCTSVDTNEVIAFCRQYLADYKCPKKVELLPSLPRNASGKILKTTLREPYWQHMERPV